MAIDWLDLARYADTYGYQADVERDMSPYRDWVIRAFNHNLPYDQFLTWQLAGDLLPNATREQRIATAFNRLHRQTNEGGSIEEEFRTEYVVDRVNTFGTAMLGLTLECARCHDHKFDPITQRDYYSLFAFFNNIDESGLYSHFTNATPSPSLLLWPIARQQAARRRHAAASQRPKRRSPRLAATARSGVRRPGSKTAQVDPPAADRASGVRRRRHGDQTPDSVLSASAQVQDGPVVADPGRVDCRAAVQRRQPRRPSGRAAVRPHRCRSRSSLRLKPTERRTAPSSCISPARGPMPAAAASS